MCKRNGSLTNERGGTLALVAVSLFVVFGIAALAIDLSMLFSARAESQRAADAAALAGASAFQDRSADDPEVVSDARSRALQLAANNWIQGTPVDTVGATAGTPIVAPWGGVVTAVESNEVELNIIPDSQRVRVWVGRRGLLAFFARTFGFGRGAVRAMATAHVTSSGQGKCMKPLAIPDIWDEKSNACGSKPQDCNANKLWDSGEGWDFNPSEGDRYVQYTDQVPDGNGGYRSPTEAELADMTGYGSDWRNSVDGVENDQGRVITIKAQSPGEAITSGFFYPWRIGDSQGADDYRENITGCNPAVTQLGVPYRIENGNMVGPTEQAFGDLIAMDPRAEYDEDTHTIVDVDSRYGDWRNSPRVVPLAVFDPNQIAAIADGKNNGTHWIVFNNFALFFIEGFDTENCEDPCNQPPLKGRFLYYASGSGTGPVLGPLVKQLQLIQ